MFPDYGSNVHTCDSSGSNVFHIMIFYKYLTSARSNVYSSTTFEKIYDSSRSRTNQHIDNFYKYLNPPDSHSEVKA